MYTEDVDYRMRTVFAILVVLSILLAYGLESWVPTYPRVIAPATLLFYGALFWLFDAFLWKVPGIRLLNSGIPNLAGIWKGTLLQSVDGVESPLSAELTIHQTWSKIKLVLHTNEAVSRNTLMGMVLKNPEAIVLTWVYRIDGTTPVLLTDKGRGIIEMTLNRSTNQATLKGAFIEAYQGEALDVSFVKGVNPFWNPRPF
jgi:SMODS-associating 2TM, beta-strand rich effector domain